MTGQSAENEPDRSNASEEERATLFVENLFGGRVVKMKRLNRWRPAWFVDVDIDGSILKLHLRGDRRSDVLPFPSLHREADILQLLEAGEIPVPHVYGMCPDPLAIVMDAVPGVRTMTGPSETQQAIAEQYVGLLAKMHQMDTNPFYEIGLERPNNASEIGLGMLDAYLPLFHRTKAAPEPLIEFAMAWARRNVPANRTRPSFVHWDSGQFLHHNNQITALYDFETCLVGDPLMDLAALRLRNPAEPLGAELTHLFRHYETVVGEPIDVAALRFHTVVFALVGVMALAGPMVNPQVGSPHLEYLWWDLMQRRALVWALAECIGVDVRRPSAPQPSIKTPALAEPDAQTVSPQARYVSVPLLQMLDDARAQLATSGGPPKYQQQAVSLLEECAERTSEIGAAVEQANLFEYNEVLGQSCETFAEARVQLEDYVTKADRLDDTQLIQCFAREVERMLFSLEPIADRVVGYDLAPVELTPTQTRFSEL